MNSIEMLVKSIGQAAAGPESADSWSQELEQEVAKTGKFKKSQVLYVPVQPPPFFWDYNCQNCRFYQEANQCKLVQGFVAKGGWCVIFMPPADNKPFTWPERLLKDLPEQIAEAPKAFQEWRN